LKVGFWSPSRRCEKADLIQKLYARGRNVSVDRGTTKDGIEVHKKELDIDAASRL